MMVNVLDITDENWTVQSDINKIINRFLSSKEKGTNLTLTCKDSFFLHTIPFTVWTFKQIRRDDTQMKKNMWDKCDLLTKHNIDQTEQTNNENEKDDVLSERENKSRIYSLQIINQSCKKEQKKTLNINI